MKSHSRTPSWCRRACAAVSLAALAATLTGCATSKSRSFEAQGMYVSDTGQLAVGKVQVDAIPDQVDSAIIHYAEDTALLSPSTKTHKIDVILTGANSTANAQQITSAICNAFVAVAPTVAKAPQPSGGTALDLAEANRKATSQDKALKADYPYVGKAPDLPAASNDCPECDDTDCSDGSCSVPL